MSKFTNVRKWAKEKGFEITQPYPNSKPNAIRVVIDSENSFICESRESTVYMSIRGKKGDPKGLYLTHDYKPKNRFVPSYGFWVSSQKEMIERMESNIKDINKAELKN